MKHVEPQPHSRKRGCMASIRRGFLVEDPTGISTLTLTCAMRCPPLVPPLPADKIHIYIPNIPNVPNLTDILRRGDGWHLPLWYQFGEDPRLKIRPVFEYRISKLRLTCDEPLVQQRERHGHRHVQQDCAQHRRDLVQAQYKNKWSFTSIMLVFNTQAWHYISIICINNKSHLPKIVKDSDAVMSSRIVPNIGATWWKHSYKYK